MAKTAKKTKPTFFSFEKDCANMVVNMDSFLARNYGDRCADYEPDCCVCKAWHLRDIFKAHACD